jgi:hypothetical protein
MDMDYLIYTCGWFKSWLHFFILGFFSLSD